MGFLGLGEPLSYEESKKHGITQFLNIYTEVKTHRDDKFLWGDEDEESGLYKVLVCYDDLIKKVKGDTEYLFISYDINRDNTSSFHPEYAGYMIEATPNKPYGSFIGDLLEVERNMNRRRKTVLKHLPKDTHILSAVNFPYMGVGDFTIPSYKPRGPIALSDTVPDEIINSHPRFATLTKNIRSRRGEKVNINIPLFPDTNTKDVDKGITMDCMGYGMGCCCLQVTFQARDLDESRKLHDQLTVISPVMLALTAASPIWQGKLSNIDTRWNVISASCDDRTKGERGEEPLKPGEKRIPKSRYSSIDLYIANTENNRPEYNDIDVPIDKTSYNRLIDEGVDVRLARHIAHLFVRDPLVVFNDRIYVDDEKSSEHFENFQSTNWQSARWKPPPPTGPVNGWRVELRTMEAQLTDYENAAFTIFTALLSRTVLFFDLDLYIPISKVDENMERAHHINAVLKEKFWFKRHIVALQNKCSCCTPITTEEDEYGEFTVKEILLGHHRSPGLIPMIYAYLDIIGCKGNDLLVIQCYMKVIINRINGTTMTTASWIRDFVVNHSDYKHDSVVTPTIFNDLMEKFIEFTETGKCCCNLLESSYSGEIPDDKVEAENILKVRMRGQSFHDEISCDKCKEISELIESKREEFESSDKIEL